MQRAARWGFGGAAAYGLIATIQLYFRPPPPGAAEWYWGFAGAAAATQLLYALIAWAPVRLRPTIPVGIASKLSFALPVTGLWLAGRADRGMFVAALVDLALAAMFLWFFVRLPRT